ncbi:MAG: adenylate/guanylate cyclase domain-containing protein [Nitrospirota bacterium]
MVSSAVFLALLIYRPVSVEERVEVLTLDYRFHLRNLILKPAQPQDTLIVAIDEKSLREFGRWPWNRELMAELVNGIIAMEPKILAVDIFFAEPESAKSDMALGEAFSRAGEKIVLAMTFDELVDASDESPEVPDQIIDSAFLKIENTTRMHPVIAEKALPVIQEIAQGRVFGHVNSHPDLDGKLRWEILYLAYGDEIFPSLALQAARVYLGVTQDEMVIAGDKGIRLGQEYFIPADRRGRLLINYYGKEGTFRFISAADILRKKIRPEEVNGRIVLLGTSAIATYDMKNTPFSANMPGVEKNATVIENILHHSLLRKSIGYVEIAVILLTGIMTGFFLPRLNALKGALLSFALFSGYVLAVQFLFTSMNLWVNFVYPAANIIMIAVAVTVAKYFFEERKSREIRAMFSSYVSPKIVETLISNPEKAKLGGDRKMVTVLFSDIKGFTSLSEKRPPEEVVEILNEYFKEMADIIFRWDGTLDKFVGDEIMAFWGAPADQPNHAELALRCALHMEDSLARMQDKWRREGKEMLDCGIGINTGEVIIGNIGAAGKKMDYTVIGDHVNLAARVEKLTRDYQAKILITEFTMEHIRTSDGTTMFGHYTLNERDTVKVKGRQREIKIFELKGLAHERSQTK